MKTGIIITYGPATDRDGVFESMIKYVDMVRINMSHGDEKQWAGFIKRIRDCEKSSRRKVKIIADLPGPKIRLSRMSKPIKLKKGHGAVLEYGKKGRGDWTLPMDYDLAPHVKKGNKIYIGDGRPMLMVESVEGKKIYCTTVEEGVASSNKGVSVMGMSTVSPPTKEDLKLAKLALRLKVDMFAISFIMDAADIKKLRQVVGKIGIVAKIERVAAMKNIDKIAKGADMLMVARGDLAFDVGIEMVPVAQMRILEACRKADKPGIVATQMLLSMVSSPIPTRAEVSDVGHAVMDGAKYVMLSEESAVGSYPLEAVRTMHQIIANVCRFMK